jgi:hypothetical protein
MMSGTDKMNIVVREGLEKACTEFTIRIEPRGFRRTLKMFWTRRHPLTVDLIHVHHGGDAHGSPFNALVDLGVQFGIRVLNDDFPGLALNGPQSTPDALLSGRYHLRFNAETGCPFNRCVDDLARFVVEQGETWFQQCRSVESLLRLPDSPLRAREWELLLAAQEGRENEEHVAKSLNLLGIKAT